MQTQVESNPTAEVGAVLAQTIATMGGEVVGEMIERLNQKAGISLAHVKRERAQKLFTIIAEGKRLKLREMQEHLQMYDATAEEIAAELQIPKDLLRFLTKSKWALF